LLYVWAVPHTAAAVVTNVIVELAVWDICPFHVVVSFVLGALDAESVS
jgi:hypothetical protein